MPQILNKWWLFALVAGILTYFTRESAPTASVVLLFCFSMIILLKGADYLVDGSSSLAAYYGVSPMIIGLTVVAFGTSVPELTVSLMAAFKDVTDISIGNIVGSNIANIGLILGIAAAIKSIKVRDNTLKFDAPFMLLSAVLLFFGALNSGYDLSGYTYSIGRIDGILFLAFFGYFLFKIIKRGVKQYESAKKGSKKENPFMFYVSVVGGIMGVIWGGDLLVDSASTIARTFGVSEAVIGLTIVSIGTSLPELITSAVAAFKKQIDIAVGNVIGSNIFNTFWVLGLVGLIHPLEVKASVVGIDIPLMMLFSSLLVIFLATGKKLSRKEGFILIALYLGYLGFLGVRGFGIL